MKKLKHLTLILLLPILTACFTDTAQHNLQNFYTQAGFAGQVIDVDWDLEGLSTPLNYIYEEKSDSHVSTIHFTSMTDIRDDEKPEQFDSQDELAQHHLSRLIEPLFHKTFEQSQAFQHIKQQIAQTLSYVAAVPQEIHLNYSISLDDTVLISHLKQDLKNHEHSHLRGISNLNLEKYLSLNMYKIDIYLDKPIPDFAIEKLSVQQLPNATYNVHIPDETYSDLFTIYIDFIIKDGQIVEILEDYTHSYK